MVNFKTSLVLASLILSQQSLCAQGLKTTVFSSGNTNTTTKVSEGNEVIKINTNKETIMSGGSVSDTMSFNLAGNGVTGSINEFVLDLVNSDDIQDTDVPTQSFDAALNGILEVDNNDPSFSISGQINQVSANMDFTSNESGNTEITRDEDFVIDSFTESFASEAGNYNGL